MTTSLLEIILDRLTDQGITGPIWINYQPDQPDTSIVLVLTGGFQQDTLGDENLIETFQVKVRAGQLDFATLEQKCRDIYDALHSADLSADGINMIQALASGPLTWNDEKNRVCGSLNFQVTRARDFSLTS